MIYCQEVINLTPEELKLEYLRWIMDETNNKFDFTDLPGGVKIALDLLVKLDPLEFDVVSEKLSDMSQTFAVNENGIPLKVMAWLKPYYRLKSL